MVDATQGLAAAALALPGEVRRLMTRASRGELEVQFGGVQRQVERVVAVGRQLIYTLVGGTAAALAVIFEGPGQGDAAVTAWRVCAGAGVSWRCRCRQPRP